MIAATEDPYWKLPPHPHDVVVRNFGQTLSPKRSIVRVKTHSFFLLNHF